MGSDRARQFLPFDALKGFKEEIRKREKIKVDKIELSEDLAFELEYKLKCVKKGMIIKVVHYCNDEYLETYGMVSDFNETFKYLTIVKTKIYFNDILDIKGENIKSIDF